MRKFHLRETAIHFVRVENLFFRRAVIRWRQRNTSSTVMKLIEEFRADQGQAR
jgi:hypothetical protein